MGLSLSLLRISAPGTGGAKREEPRSIFGRVPSPECFDTTLRRPATQEPEVAADHDLRFDQLLYLLALGAGGLPADDRKKDVFGAEAKACLQIVICLIIFIFSILFCNGASLLQAANGARMAPSRSSVVRSQHTTIPSSRACRMSQPGKTTRWCKRPPSAL